MSYLDRVAYCNTFDSSKFVALLVEDKKFGWVRRDRIEVLTSDASPLKFDSGAVTFEPGLSSARARTEAIAAVAPLWVEDGLVRKLRGEIYPVRRTWSEPDCFLIDRALTPLLGTRAFGVHLNGFVERPDGIYLWIGRRSADRQVEPDKLDNLVAGGQPAQLSIEENLKKECEEEAGMPAQMANSAHPVGTVSYCFEERRGLRVDTLFCYDLRVPDDFEPVNQDGEISEFQLMPVAEALDHIKAGPAFKFNVSLVILDFAIRHGLISPDHEPDYERILAGLHAPAPG